MKLEFSEKALVHFAALAGTDRAAVAKALELLQSNRRHPSLRFKKLTGTSYWYARTSKGHRVILEMKADDLFLVVAIGNHDLLKRFG